MKMSFEKFSRSKSHFGKDYKKAERNYRNGVAIEKLKFHYDYEIQERQRRTL